MKKSHDLLGILLASFTGTALLTSILLRTFLPRIILPSPDASAVAALTLLALLAEHYLCPRSRRDFRVLPLYAVLIFGLFPLAAALVSPWGALKLALIGGVLCTALAFVFDSLLDRLSDTPAARIAPVAGALALFLSTQCLMGIF